MTEATDIRSEIRDKFGAALVGVQETADATPTLWVTPERVHDILRYLKFEAPSPFRMLYDLTAIDERNRRACENQPRSTFTVVYQVLSFERNSDVRLKVALDGEKMSLPTITDLWPSANWYEREVWDMFGVSFKGHPHLERILMPPMWNGHPLRKDFPARATEMEPYGLSYEKAENELEAQRFFPEEWGMQRSHEDADFMFLNIGPHHPSTHGPFRIVVQIDGEIIVDAVPFIGYHHRGAEKMGERQTWHTFIPYTDRVDYLGGVVNNLAYLLSVERLAGIQVPPRAEVIRVMLAELFRIASHLVWYGTFAADVGAMSPVFYMFTDRERIMDIIKAICGARMHPGWFRIGGVAQDLPKGWERLVRDFVRYMPRRLREYDTIVLNNPIFRARTKGVGALTTDKAIDWSVTGPNLRACGFEWDFRKKRPYSGYERFEFDIPTGNRGDCHDRALVRAEEMRQSLRIIEQCLDNMPEGPYKSDHPLTTPPLKERTMQDIETLINHFLSVTWGPVMPCGEACMPIEGTKGYYGYYLVSDGGTNSYRTRIRTASFPHLQMVPEISRGGMIPDLVAILGSIDFVMGDVDR